MTMSAQTGEGRPFSGMKTSSMDGSVPLDLVWAYTVLETLRDCGISTVCVSPGSRSTPLVLALELLHKQDGGDPFKVFNHIDERGLGFFALGCSKADEGRQVAVICTSGTAVANYLPAVIEAYQSRYSLVMITADRPFDLHDNGANQSINQESIFNRFVADSVRLPVPNSENSLQAMYHRVFKCIQQGRHYQQPVHINMPFKEPFTLHYSKEVSLSAFKRDLGTFSVERYSSHSRNSNTVTGKVLFSIGGHVPLEQAMSILDFCETHSIPVLVDVTSGLRNYKSSVIVPHYMFQDWAQEKNCPDVLIQFGRVFVDKRYLSLVDKATTYMVVAPYEWGDNPTNRACHYFMSNYVSFLETLTVNSLTKNYRALLCDKDRVASVDVSVFSEPALALGLSHLLTEKINLFLGNSLSIRMYDRFSVCTHTFPTHVYTNRGASGIDGLLATASGIVASTHRPMIAVIGDMSFLHDVNSLCLLKKHNLPLLIIVPLNQGGQIFSHLPITQAMHLDSTEAMSPVVESTLETYFVMHQDVDFEKIVEGFGLAYESVSQQHELDAYVQKWKKSPFPGVVGCHVVSA